MPPRRWFAQAVESVGLLPEVIEYLKNVINSRILYNGETGSSVHFKTFLEFRMDVFVDVSNDAAIADIFGGNEDLLSKMLVDYSSSSDDDVQFVKRKKVDVSCNNNNNSDSDDDEDFIDASAKDADGLDVDDEDVQHMEKDELLNFKEFVDDDTPNDDVSMYRQYDNAVNLLDVSMPDYDDDDELTGDEIKTREIVRNLSQAISRNVQTDLKLQQQQQAAAATNVSNGHVDDDDLEGDYEDVCIETDEMQVDEADEQRQVDHEHLMTEGCLSRLKRFYAAMVRSLAVLETGNGECISVSIVNAIVASKMIQQYEPTYSDEKLKLLLGDLRLFKILTEERPNLQKAELEVGNRWYSCKPVYDERPVQLYLYKDVAHVLITTNVKNYCKFHLF